MTRKRLVWRSLIFIGLTASAALIGAVTANAQRLAPSDYAAQLRLAQVYEETRDLANAVRIYESLYKADPSDETVFNALVRDYFYLKRYVDVEQVVKAKLTTETNDLELVLILARAEARLNKKDEAMEAFRKAESMGNMEDCMAVLPIATAMVDVTYEQEAMDILAPVSSSESFACAGQAANLYLRMGKYGDATKAYLAMLQSGDGNLPLVEQRLAQYTSDSTARMLTLDALKLEIDRVKPTLPALQLLAWMYGEQKDYAHALEIVTRIDDMNGQARAGNQGFELLVFAERARNEGALGVAVSAYNEAIRRIKSGSGSKNDYFLAQAELGALMTNEAYLLQNPAATNGEFDTLISRYETYGEKQTYNEFALDALNRGASLAYLKLFDLKRSNTDYDKTLARAKSYSDRVKVALFGLVDNAFASADFGTAQSRMDAIGAMLDKRKVNGAYRSEDRETDMHLLYERALLDYYQDRFDSAIVKLKTIVDNPASDYANDAIQLSTTITENGKPANLESLKRYAKANLSEFERDYPAALASYKTIYVTSSSSPIADDAMLKAADVEVKLGRPDSAVSTLETFGETMASSPLLDQAAFRQAEIVERELHDKRRAQKMYEDFLAHFPKSNFCDEARGRARRLRGDVF